MSKIACLTILFAFVTIGTALDCYSCDGDRCNNKKLWEKVLACGVTVKGTDEMGACLTEVYIEKNPRNSTKRLTKRQCIIARNVTGKPEHKCENDEKTVLECKVCSTDYCNSGSHATFSSLFLLGVVITWMVNKIA